VFIVRFPSLRGEAIAWAELVIRAFEEPANADKAALRIDGKMVE
jgi:citrate lyase beta subunit